MKTHHNTPSHAINIELSAINDNFKANRYANAKSIDKAKKDFKTPIIATLILAVCPATAFILSHFGLISNF
jgi:hypothetical protein